MPQHVKSATETLHLWHSISTPDVFPEMPILQIFMSRINNFLSLSLVIALFSGPLYYKTLFLSSLIILLLMNTMDHGVVSHT